MKKFGSFIIAAFAALAFTACNNEDNDYPAYMSFVTVHPQIVGNDYYFETDHGETIYPGDKSRIGAYQAKEGQRAIITFNLLDKIEGYDHNAALYAIGNIYTGEARIVNLKEELDELKDNPLVFSGAQLTKTYLTMSVGYPVYDNSKHEFHLIVNDVEPSATYPDYLDVELRHDAGGETQGTNREFYLSFSVKDPVFKAKMEGKKGIALRVNEGYGTKRYKIDVLRN